MTDALPDTSRRARYASASGRNVPIATFITPRASQPSPPHRQQKCDNNQHGENENLRARPRDPRLSSCADRWPVKHAVTGLETLKRGWLNWSVWSSSQAFARFGNYTRRCVAEEVLARLQVAEGDTLCGMTDAADGTPALSGEQRGINRTRWKRSRIVRCYRPTLSELGK